MSSSRRRLFLRVTPADLSKSPELRQILLQAMQNSDLDLDLSIDTQLDDVDTPGDTKSGESRVLTVLREMRKAGWSVGFEELLRKLLK